MRFTVGSPFICSLPLRAHALALLRDLPCRLQEPLIGKDVHVLAEPPPPEAPPFVRGVAEVTVDGFLSRFAAWVAPHEYTVRDLILYVANIKGAVHAGRATNDREEVLVATGNQIRVGGFDPSVYTLFSIAEVVLHGLDPIRKLVVEEMESSALDAEAEW